MVRVHHPSSRRSIDIVSLLLVYTFCLALYAPFIEREAQAAPVAREKTVSTKAMVIGQAVRRARRRDGELIVRFREGFAERDKDALVGARGARRKQRLRGRSRIEKLELASGQEPEAVAEQLRYLPGVEFAEPNYLISRDEVVPDDPRFAEQWTLKNTGQNGSQVGSDINAAVAWDATTGSANTVIAVIDSGIDFSHPDLRNNQWTNSAETDNRRDDDNDGHVDDLHGWDWVTNSNVIRDEQGHGTIIAGIIAAQGNNRRGISGVMWRAGLMSLRVLDNTGTGDVADAIEAIDYATAHGAQVINCSWGTEEMSVALRDAIERAGRAGVVVVCSAGNGGRDLEVSPYYPASFGLSNVIAVASTDGFDSLTSWSNYGATHVTVAAPGTDILTTQMGGGYRSVSGTSASAPVVSGVAGLIKTRRGWLSGAQVIAAIKDGARQVVSLSGRISSGGVVSAAGALAAMPGSSTPPSGGGNNGNGYGPPPPPPPGQGGGTGGGSSAPPVTSGTTGANLPNLDSLREQSPTGAPPPATIHANLPCADCDLVGGGSGGGGYTPPGDPRYSTPRTRPQNETGRGGVDLGSRNFNWSLPLVNLPGRAGLDLNLSLTYNSLVWTKEAPGIKFNADRGTPAPGFRLGLPVLQPRFTNSDTNTSAYIMITPSGGRNELRQVGTSNVYESADGTYTQLIDNVSNAIVTTTDGTQLTFLPSVDNEMRCTQVKDRNGNYISVTYTGYGHIDYITDTLGRVVDFEYYADNNLEKITQSWGGTPHVWARFEYGQLLVQPNFPGLMVTGPNNTNQTVLTRVRLEDNSYHDFSYTNWGQVWKATRFAANGAQLAYAAYNLPGSPLLASSAQTDCPRFTEQRVWAQSWNNGAEAVTTYSIDPNGAWSQMMRPDGTVYKETFATTGWQKGLTTRSDVIVGGVSKKWTTVFWTQDDTNLSYQKNPRPNEINVYDEANNRRRTVITYTSQFGLPSDVDEYAVDGTTVLRRTHTDYEWDAAYINRRIIGLPTFRVLYEGTSQLQAKTAYTYDWWPSHYEATPQPSTQHDATNYGLNLIRGRGNLTSETRVNINDPNNAQGTAIEHKWGYNTTGSVTFTRDPLWHQTFISYTDSFADGTNRNTFAYPTRVTDGDWYQSFAKYSYDFGATTRTEGPPPAGQTSGLVQEMIYDSRRRLTRVKALVNNAEYYYRRWVYYDDAVTEVEYSSVNNLTDDTYAYIGRDGLGNVWASAQSHPGSTGGYSAQYTYRDALNRVVQQSNPTEINASFQATGDDSGGWQWTLQQYDWKGRPTVTTNPGGTTREATYGGCGCAGGEVTTIRDERGRRRRMTADILGRLSKVEELNWDASIYSTSNYTYNARDQITALNQAGQVRSFEYDGYGRAWKKTTPEQGQTIYSYNQDDTVQSVQDARGATSTFAYNGRHLPVSINYGVPAGVAPTSNVTFAYDEAGNRTAMTDGLGSISYQYDALSRLKSETRSFSGVGAFTLSYQYNRAGELTGVTGPSQFGSVNVGYTYDQMGRASAVTGSGYAGVSNYINDLSYRAFGGIKQIAYGNNRSLAVSYDNRLRMTGWSIAGVLRLQYNYGWENTGRVEFVRNLDDETLDRFYSYDHVGRLSVSRSGSEARRAIGEQVPLAYDGPYSQGYFYDQLGNMTHKEGWGAVNAQYTYAPQFVNNRMTVNPVTGTSMQYDAAGNLTNDGQQSYSYDATGQQVSASGGGLAQSYDGNGVRARKVENNQTTYYLRSSVLGQQVVAELNGSGGFQRGYVYLGGQMLAIQESNQVSWVHQDPVTKSQRLTDSSGNVTSWVELDPWGGETGRSVNSLKQPHRYTTYERDGNGGDEAMMRRYEGQWQRFAQPDPYDGSYDLTNPQSFNRYAYVQNDPVNFTDPTGLDDLDNWRPGPGDTIYINAPGRFWNNGGGGGSPTGRRTDEMLEPDGGGGGGLYDGLGEPPPGPEPKDFPCPPTGDELVNHPGYAQLAQAANQHARAGDRGYVEAGGWILMNRQGDLRWQIKTRESRDTMTSVYGLGEPQNYRNTMGNGWIVIADFHTHVNPLPGNEDDRGAADRRGVPGIWIYPSGEGVAYGPKSGLFGRALPKGC